MYKKGYIYKGLKPVYWCPHDETALAEAEIEYQDDPCTTIFVKFPVLDDKGHVVGIIQTAMSGTPRLPRPLPSTCMRCITCWPNSRPKIL